MKIWQICAIALPQNSKIYVPNSINQAFICKFRVLNENIPIFSENVSVSNENVFVLNDNVLVSSENVLVPSKNVSVLSENVLVLRWNDGVVKAIALVKFLGDAGRSLTHI
ncbi:hypothetical protein [uncultured Nostoc sp.]|uniref:hypothetical protein n=1 Tax=uncultured Nostoc sp. TaxID=340711 RepID=UPI0035CAC05A